MKILLQDYVEKYANMLTGRDVSKLFEHLKNSTNRAEAARICDLERRTTFYWTDNKEIKLQTKKQVLQALLENDYLFTLDYLCEKTLELSNETVDLYLKSLYENAMDPDTDSSQFEKLMNSFFENRIKFSSLIGKSLLDVVSDMSKNLAEQATILNIHKPKMPLAIMNGEEIVEKLPFIIKMLPKNITEESIDNIERQLELPRGLIEFASDVREQTCIVQAVPTIAYKNTAQNNTTALVMQVSAIDTASSLRFGLTKPLDQGTSQTCLTVGQSRGFN